MQRSCAFHGFEDSKKFTNVPEVLSESRLRPVGNFQEAHVMLLHGHSPHPGPVPV